MDDFWMMGAQARADEVTLEDLLNRYPYMSEYRIRDSITAGYQHMDKHIRVCKILEKKGGA